MAQCRCVVVNRESGRHDRCVEEAPPDAPFCTDCESRHVDDVRLGVRWDLWALDPVTNRLIEA